MVIRGRVGNAVLILLIVLLFTGTSRTANAQPSDLHAATAALLQGRVDEAAALLKSTIATQPDNAHAHQLLCRAYYAQDLADPAVHECELAVSNAPTDSENQMWLGRAYGLKASHASPFTALNLAKRVREAFEHAADLNPDNVQAYSDLGEFYVGAPGFVGGGLDRAKALADSMQPRFPAQSHRLLALIARKRKDTATEEAEFKNAANLARSAATYVDLASFYQQHDKTDQAVTTIHTAISAARSKDPSIVDAASILISAGREPDLAERLLREYLASPAKTDEAPAFKVHMQLGDLLAHHGNLAAARSEYAAALALASSYAPARKAIKTP